MSLHRPNNRLPLQEHPLLDSNIPAPSVFLTGLHNLMAPGKLAETPISYKNNAKISTPPESVSAVHRRVLAMPETPISKHYDQKNGLATIDVDIKNIKETALLSPAFSSPQNQFQYRFNDALSRVSQPSFGEDENPDSSLSSITVDVSSSQKQKKRPKKPKKEVKDSGFDIGSTDKPPYSYATLIGMAILGNPERKLTLSQIYLWISVTFKYYKREDVGWQNSIRHNLSLNKAFIKGDKSKDGKGHFWCIKEGCEDQFLKSRNNKKSGFHEVMDQLQNGIHKREELTKKRSINSIPSSPNTAADEEPNTFDSTVKRRLSDYDNDGDYEEDDEENDNNDNYRYSRSILDHPNKKLKHNDFPLAMTNLGAPFGQWHEEDHSNKSTTTPHMSNTPQFVITRSPEKPMLAGKNLTYTSSFSCNSNLELSPVRPSETGPLLEPLTPANNNIFRALGLAISLSHHNQLHSLLFNTTTGHNQTPLPAIGTVTGLQAQPSLSAALAPIGHDSHTQQALSHQQVLNGPATILPNLKTPKSSMKTPVRILKTPQTQSMMKRLWNSPSYLEEFYYSPLITSSHGALNSYDDDDMILRAFESPCTTGNPHSAIRRGLLAESKGLLGDLRKAEKVPANLVPSLAGLPVSAKDKKHIRNVGSATEAGDN